MHHSSLDFGLVRRFAPCLALVSLLVAPAVHAAPDQAPPSRHLWATVNVCDTLKHPDTIGIRASMPGFGKRRERMFMRFRVHYFRASDQMWHNISKGGDSGFFGVGHGALKASQAGRLFVFAPSAGGSWHLRAKVYFEWRLGKKVVRRAAMTTTAGHRSTAGSDPPGYSSDTCVIS